MTREEVLGRLRDEIMAAGGLRTWGRAHGFSAGFLSDVLIGRRRLTWRVLKALGLRRVVVEHEHYLSDWESVEGKE